VKFSHDERRERPVGLELSTEQNAPGLDSLKAQNVLEEHWRNMQHRDRLAHERQHGGQALERFSIARQREVTGPSPRGHSKLRQMHCQPLLQLACATGSHQCGPRRAGADVDEQAGIIGLRARTGKRGRRGPRSSRRADGCD
jgi:hypothetical protein